MIEKKSFVGMLHNIRQKSKFVAAPYCEDDCGENCQTNQD